MKEIRYDGNIFILPENDRKYGCVVTTNGIIRRDGKAVMGAGIARYCRDMFNGIDTVLGEKLRNGGNHVYNLGQCNVFRDPDFSTFLLYSFPTKDDWKEDSKPELIRQSCREMAKMAKEDALDMVYMPCPGCANGRLDYWKDVRQILLEELDDTFTVCIPGKIYEQRVM